MGQKIRQSDCEEIPDSEELVAKMRRNPSNAAIVVMAIQKKRSGMAVQRTIMTLGDESRLKGNKIIGDLSGKGKDVIPVGTTEVAVVHGIPNVGNNVVENITPPDYQLAQACGHAAAITSLVNGEVVAKLDKDAVERVKLTCYTAASVASVVAVIHSTVSTVKVVGTYHGLDWAARLYTAIINRSPADKMNFVAGVQRAVLQPVPLKSYSAVSKKQEPTRGIRNLKQEEARYLAHVDSRCILQNGPIPVSTSTTDPTVEGALQTLTVSRAIRGKDNVGLSGMTLGCYTSELISKRSAITRDAVAVISQVAVQPKKRIIVIGVPNELARDVSFNFKGREIYFEGLARGTVKDVESRMTYANKKDCYVFDFTSIPYRLKKNVETTTQYADELTEDINALAEKYSKIDCHCYVFRHFWLGQKVNAHPLVPPAPHNLVGYFCVGAKCGATLTGEQYRQLSISANFLRNGWLFHRAKVWEILSKRTGVKSPLVPYCLAPRVVVHTPDDIREVIEAGQLENIEFDSYFADVHPESDEDDGEFDEDDPDGAEEEEDDVDESVEEEKPLKRNRAREKKVKSKDKDEGEEGKEYAFSQTDSV